MPPRWAWLAGVPLSLCAPAWASDDRAADQPPHVELSQGRLDGGIWSWSNRLEGRVVELRLGGVIEEWRNTVSARLDVVKKEQAKPSQGAEASLDGDVFLLDQVDPDDFEIPIAKNDAVKRWMKYFLGRGRVHFSEYLERSTRYGQVIGQELDAAGLPQELLYLAMIESGFNDHAYSRAGAAGVWQFMPSTGRMYQLRVDWWVDDRRDPTLSTRAAVRHLGDLNKMYDGDWLLTWSAYNAGPGRVRRAIKKAGSRDFWQLSAGGHLPRETSNYVAKLIAVSILGTYRDRYGFGGLQYDPALKVDQAKVGGSVDLVELARCAGTDLEHLKKLNPGLRRWATPAEGYLLRLPAGSKKAFLNELKKIDVASHVRFYSHEVRSGETLSGIAVKYGASITSLLRANQLGSADHIRAGMTLIVPLNNRDARQLEAKDKLSPFEHRIQLGETLSGIALNYQVSVSQLRRWNQLASDHIEAGNTLRLRPPDSVARGFVSYTVRVGDSLSAIAVRYGLKVADLQRANTIRNPHSVQIGRTLSIPLSGSGWSTYVVRAGDNLGVIAGRHSCTVEELRSWNALKTTVIQPGQELRVRD